MTKDSSGLEVLLADECLHLLATHEPNVGRVAVWDNGEPLVTPVNYVMHEGVVVFRTGPGTKLDAAIDGEVVGFEADAINPSWREGWSVVLQGRAELVRDPRDIETYRELPLRPWAPAAPDRFVRIVPHHISGRSIDVGRGHTS